MFRLPVKQILRALAPVFADRGETVTIKHYTGTERSGNVNVDGYEEFSVTAIVGKKTVWAKDSSNKVKAQALVQRVTFRAPELPAGLAQKDLTNNDKIVYGGQEMDVSTWRHVEGVSSQAQVEGG